MALIAENIKNATKLLGTDLIIVYGFSQIHRYGTSAHPVGYRLMGNVGTGKSHVREMSSIMFSIFTWFKDYRHPYQPTWQACSLWHQGWHD